MALALGLVVLGAAIVLVGAGRSGGTTPGVPAAPDTSSGTAAASALALVALAGAGAALLVGRWARTAIGVVLLGVAVATSLAGLSPTRWAALTGGVLIGLGALAVVVRAHRWPQPRRRYETPTRRPGGTPRDTWDALDRGEDPTA
jgi:hypothetical protein